MSGLYITAGLVAALVCRQLKNVRAALLCRLAKPNFTYNTSTFKGDCGESRLLSNSVVKMGIAKPSLTHITRLCIATCVQYPCTQAALLS